MKILSVLVAFSIMLSGTSFACSEDGSSGFLPENDFNIPVGAKRRGGLSEAQFNAVIDKVEAIYAPIVDEMGGELKIARKWEDGTVNANATRIFGWNVNMYGGLARHETITEDGFALVLCHEIGHHLGGAPKVGFFLNRWASNEGQADYFATLKCLRKTFLNDDNVKIVRKMKAPKTLIEACTKQWRTLDESALCVRNGMAGASVSNLFAALRNKPEGKFETPDTTVVSRTNDAHPDFQCRLDTYFQGALCEVSMNEEVSQKDEVQGTCHRSLGHEIGVRPLCWFKPKK